MTNGINDINISPKKNLDNNPLEEIVNDEFRDLILDNELDHEPSVNVKIQNIISDEY